MFFFIKTLVFAIFSQFFPLEESKLQTLNILPNSEQIHFSSEYSSTRLSFLLLCYIATSVEVTTNTGVLLELQTLMNKYSSLLINLYLSSVLLTSRHFSLGINSVEFVLSKLCFNMDAIKIKTLKNMIFHNCKGNLS